MNGIATGIIRWLLFNEFIRMNKADVFIAVNLPTGGEATVLEGYGEHYFKALHLANGDSSLLLKHLVLQLVRVDGKPLSEAELDEMHMRDVSYLIQVISTMLSNDFKL